MCVRMWSSVSVELPAVRSHGVGPAPVLRRLSMKREMSTQLTLTRV